MTDAIAAMGLGNGDHSLGEQKVTVTDGIKATLTGTDTLAGACVPMAECCRNFMAATQCSVPEVVAAVPRLSIPGQGAELLREGPGHLRRDVDA